MDKKKKKQAIYFQLTQTPHWEAAHYNQTVKDTKPLNAEGQHDNAD